MELGLQGRTAVITGGSKGIGFGVAVNLANEGCEVQIVARDKSLLETAQDMLNNRHFNKARRSAAQARDEAIRARELAQQATEN